MEVYNESRIGDSPLGEVGVVAAKQNSAVEPWLVIGAALYWGAIVVSFLLPDSAPQPSSFFAGALVRYVLLAVFVAFGFAMPQAFSTERGRRVTLCGMIAASVLAEVVSLLGTSVGAPLTQGGTVCHLFSIAMLMVLWGFAFASMDKRRAGQNVAVTMLLATAVVLGALALVGFIPRGLVTRALMLASGAILLTGRVRFRNLHREPSGDEKLARKQEAPFVLSRVAFGLTMGVCIEAPFQLVPDDVSLPLTLLGGLVLVAALAMHRHASSQLYFALPTLIVLTIGVSYLPFFEDGLTAAAKAATGAVWLAWAEFSAFQLSDLKERYGVSELSLCLQEKFVLSCSMAMGIALFRLCWPLIPATPDALHTLEICLFSVSCILILATVYAAGRLIGERAEDHMRDELARSRREHTEAIYDQVASEHGLTPREREVMGMLAEGYTRAYIREALDVSDGTAKAHIAHVYAKLGIHHKDDLLDYIDQRVARG